MKRYLLFSLLSLVLLPACKKDKTVVADNLVFGDFAGMCMADCVDMYRVDTATLYEDTVVKNSTLNETYNFMPGPALSADKFAIARSLLMEVPGEMLSGSEHTYGTPDSHDQGGVYLQVTKGTSVYRIRIDNDNGTGVPAAVGTFRDRVISVIRQLQ